MLHLIVKPGNKKKTKLLNNIENRLKERGRECEIHFTACRGDGTAIARALTERGERELVAVGGDGMLNEVLMGLSDPSACTLGLIPAGTGNDFAAVAGIPHGLEALALILDGEPKFTDYIQFSNGRRSVNIAGIGIDADILMRCERMKHFRAKSKYFLSLLQSLAKYRGAKMKVKWDFGEAEGNFLLAAVCNGRQFGGGIPICPPARIDDGKLELVYVDCPKPLKIPFALIKLMRGKVFSLPFAHHVLCEHAEFLFSGTEYAQYDGELFKEEEFCADIVHGALRMYRGQL